MDTYITPTEATHVRVSRLDVDDRGQTWAIDAADDHGHHTLDVWDWDNVADDRIRDVDHARQLAAYFAGECVPHLGDAPVAVEQEDGSWMDYPALLPR